MVVVLMIMGKVEAVIEVRVVEIIKITKKAVKVTVYVIDISYGFLHGLKEL